MKAVLFIVLKKKDDDDIHSRSSPSLAGGWCLLCWIPALVSLGPAESNVSTYKRKH